MEYWFGKNCRHQGCVWEDNEITGGPDYREYTPVLIHCGNVKNPDECEGSCNKKLCPIGGMDWDKALDIIDMAISSLKYCEDKYGYDDQARLNIETGIKNI